MTVFQSASPDRTALPASAAAAPRTPWRSILRFVGLSGLGWLLDFSILLALVAATLASPAVANAVSASVAALTVFCISRYTVFRAAERHLALRIAGYLIYTLGCIAVTSTIIGRIVPLLHPFVLATMPVDASWAPTAVAKILVTPPQLVLNFSVARLLNERALPQRGPALRDRA